MSAVFVVTAILALRASADHPHAAPHVTSLTNHQVLYSVPKEHYVVLERGPVRVVVVDNAAVDVPQLPRHGARYNGVASLIHRARKENLFAPGLAGLNFEHIHDGTPKIAKQIFEPRVFPMQLRVVDRYTVEVYQPETGIYKLESCGRYRLLDDGTIEYTFECIPRDARFKKGYIGLFWASYIDRPESGAIYFVGRQKGMAGSNAVEPSAAGSSNWIAAESPAHGVKSTHPPDRAHFEPTVDPRFPKSLLVNHPSGYVYGEPVIVHNPVCGDGAAGSVIKLC